MTEDRLKLIASIRAYIAQSPENYCNTAKLRCTVPAILADTIRSTIDESPETTDPSSSNSPPQEEKDESL